MPLNFYTCLLTAIIRKRIVDVPDSCLPSVGGQLGQLSLPIIIKIYER